MKYHLLFNDIFEVTIDSPLEHIIDDIKKEVNVIYPLNQILILIR